MRLLLLAAAAYAQLLSGGDYDMPKHGLGPVARGSAFEAGGSTWSLTSLSRGYSAAYPLLEAGGLELYPAPSGLLLYMAAMSNTIADPGASVAVPAAALPEDFEFFVDDPLVSPMRADPALVAQANDRLSLTLGPQASIPPGGVKELNVLGESGTFYDGALAAPAVIGIPYQDADNDGVVDGSDPPVRADTLAMYSLDETLGRWVRVPGSSVDAAGRRVTAAVPHFSVYAIIGSASQDVGAVHPFPVPWAPNSGNPADGTLAGGITFTNLPSEGAIYVYTLTGRLVRKLDIPGLLVPAQLRWDVKNESGQDVASGVYLWRVVSGKNVKIGKLMVIR